MTTIHRAEALRLQFAAADRSGAGKPFPEHLRKAAVAHANEAMADGDSLQAVAHALGISPISIRRWMGRYGAQWPGTLQRVQIVPDSERESMHADHGPLVVHTAGGLRLEGLTLEAVVQLVRAVG